MAEFGEDLGEGGVVIQILLVVLGRGGLALRTERLIAGNAAGFVKIELEFGKVLEMVGGVFAGAGILFEVVADEIGFGEVGELADLFEIFIASGSDIELAPFGIGKEAALHALERAEIAIEIGEGSAGFEGGKDAILDEREDAFAGGGGVRLVIKGDGIGVLGEELGVDGVAAALGVETAEGSAAGGEGEAAGVAGAGEDFDNVIVGVFVAKAEDVFLIAGIQTFEHV